MMELKKKTIKDYSHFKPTPESSNISYIAYDDKNQLMAVGFKGGSRYEYSDVPKNIWSEAVKAESIGSFVSKNIVNKFKGTKTTI